MTQKQYFKTVLITGLVLISLGGWLKHLRIHPVYSDSINYIPFISGIISVFIIPTMFMLKKFVPYAYLLNGFTVIIGTITMIDYSVSHISKNITFSTLILETTLADILILWTKFILGKILFDLEHINDLNLIHKGNFFRYPNIGFWVVHLISISIVYILGKLLRR